MRKTYASGDMEEKCSRSVLKQGGKTKLNISDEPKGET
jgi:hypothetical protein